MDDMYGRRQVLKAGLGGLAALTTLGLVGCDAPTTTQAGTQGPITLQMTFWGSTTRDALTKQAINLFQKSHPNITVHAQFKDFNSYWTWLDKDFYAKGNPPDLIQMDMRYLSQFVRQQKLLDMTQMIYNQAIDLSDYDPSLLASSKANNTIYGIPMGGNYQSWLYDKTAVGNTTLGPPPSGVTWDEFASYTTELTKALGNGMFGFWDGSGDIASFELWVRGRGKELYDRDGNVAFELDDVVSWYNYWDKLRKSGTSPPMNITSKYDISGQPQDSSLINGKTAFLMAWSNQFEAYQKASKHTLDVITPPRGPKPDMYLKASMLLSISAATKYPQAAASFVNFLNNDPGALKALGVERGVPGPAQARQMLSPQLSPNQLRSLVYVNSVSASGIASVKQVLDPPGAGKIGDTLRKVSQDIGFGRTTVTDGAQSLLKQAKQIVAQS
ncbi:MAG: extracellular solute-binding protein [Ktedonobacteraceae bacterium]|nr:extracellular solute-binding protein [Ktedonobacteraceae bacterium]